MPEPVAPRQLPPPEELTDGVIELRSIRVLGPDDAASRPAEERFLAGAFEYRFAIHRCDNGVRVGRIHLRDTNDPALIDAVGHTGYAVDEAHRRQGYASRAIRLIVGLAHRFGVSPLWVLIEADNTASRRAAERAGLRLVDEVETKAEAVALGLGPGMCRYASVDPPNDLSR